MKKIIAVTFLVTIISGAVFGQTRMDLSLYTSNRGEMQLNFKPEWQFPFLPGDNPLTAGSNVKLKLDAALSPIWAGLSGDAELTVFPFLLFTAGAMAGTGWNYDLFGSPLVGLGLNKRTGIDDQNDGVIGNGLDGAVWNVHAGAMLQFDLAAFIPGDWNHVVAQVYNEIQYLAYTKARGDDFWYYYLDDDGINQNAFRHKFTGFIGYAMPIFIDLAGVQLEGTLPFYNSEAGSAVRDRGYSFDNSFIVNFRIHKRFSIMAITCFTNGFKDPITSDYEREWAFDCVRLIATWQIK